MSPRNSGEAMRVLIMCYSLARGGAERMTVELARAWADRGCEVTVLTLAPPEADFFTLDTRIRHIHLPHPTQPNGNLVTSLLINLRRLAAIRRVLKTIRPHVALGMMSASAILLAFAGIGLPLRTYGSERIHPPTMPLRPGKGAVRTIAYGLLSGVVCQTETAASWIRQHTLARRTFVVPNHVVYPLRSLPPIVPVETVLPPERHFVLAAGRMVDQKQFPKLVSAFGELASKYPDWDLVIAGDGDQRTDLERQVATAGLSERVHMPGSLGNMADWYQQASVFAMTSGYEGFPNVLLEAMAHGAPAVAFDCPTGPSEIIADGVNGYLVPLDNLTAFVASLGRLMEDDELRVSMGASAKEVRERFSSDRVMELWFAALGLDAAS